MREKLNKWFFFLIFTAEATVWVRVAGGSNELKAGGTASAFSTGNGDPRLFAINAFVVLVTLIFCFSKFRTMLGMLLSERALLLLYAYSVLSVAWSAFPANSLRTSIYLLLGLVEFGYIGLYMTASEQIAAVGQSVSLVAVLCYPAQWLLPPSGDAAPGWTGLFQSKNYLGNLMAIGIVAILLERDRWTTIRVVKLLLCAVLLILSQSFTSLVCVLAVACVMAYLRLQRSGRLLLVGVVSSLVLFIAVVLPDFLSLLLGASGKDTTFTGRDVIWAFALNHIALHPVLGYGYYGFWISEADSALQILGWNPQQAHNGFLDLALNEGLVGVGILLYVFYTGLRRSLRLLKLGDPTGAGAWLLLMLCYLIIHNVSEADFYQRPAWVVYLIAYIAVAKAELPVRSPVPLENTQAPDDLAFSEAAARPVMG